IQEYIVPICLPPTATYQNLASKIFCLCCRDCEEAVIESSKPPSQTQGNRPPSYKFSLSGSQSQKNELNKPNLKYTNAQFLTGQEKTFSSSSSEFEGGGIQSQQPVPEGHSSPSESSSRRFTHQHAFLLSELTAYNIQTGYPKKNLSRYCQEHWTFQPCLIGRP
ncbi:hypothetical protein U0070_013796, partial [Myodes glareolus]